MNRFRRWFKATVAFAALLLVVGGAWFYQAQSTHLRKIIYADLESIAQLKANQIALWRTEQLTDAMVITESPFFSEAIRRWMETPTAGLGEDILSRLHFLENSYHYREVLLIDTSGAIRLRSGNSGTPLLDRDRQAIAEAFQTRKPVLTDLQAAPGENDPHLNVIAPVMTNKGNAVATVGAVVLKCDVRHFLYPLIQSWPVPSHTAETLLIRRDGNGVLFLNDLRHLKDAALRLRIPLSRRDVPSVMAVLGQQGVVEGNDYRGIRVLSALRAIPHSSWFMVAKIDVTEVMEVWRRQSILLISLFLGIIVAIAAVIGALWQRRDKVLFQAMFEAEAAQRKSEERYRVTLFSVGDAVITTNASGLVEMLNPVAQTLTGWSRDEAGGKPLDEVFTIINEKTRLPAVNPVNRVLSEGVVVGLANHTSLISRDGKEIPIEDSAAPIKGTDGAIAGVVLVFHDVTEKRKAENTLNKSMEKLSLALEAAHSGTWEWGLTTNENTWSKELWELYGLAPDSCEASYNVWRLTIHPDDRATVERAVQEAAGNGVELKVEWRVHHKDGIERWLMSRGRPLYDDQGKVVRYMGIVLDITERKQAEGAIRKARDELEQRVQERTQELEDATNRLIEETREREKAEQQLRQAQKMEALGTLTGGIAHDFNNILAAIIGFTELTTSRVKEGSREAQNLQRVFTAAIRGRELVRHLLTFSRQEKQERKPLRLSAIVKETINLMKASIPANIAVEVNVKQESSLILGDPVQIQQVLMNLCTNACHAMREKGGILRIELGDFSISLASEGLNPGLYMRLAVKDTGTGIPQAIADKIFDPFFTTKGTGEGTGLGLSVVHGIVRDHKGSIKVESEDGKGSTFTVYLPKIAGKQVGAAAGDEAVPTGRERVLVVDDEEPLTLMAHDLLTELGYEVVLKTSSKEALALVRLDPYRFDLVITDLAMPELTGLDLAREILAFRPDMPVILCTGYGHVDNDHAVTAAGVKALVLKPLTKKELAVTVRQVLDGQQSDVSFDPQT